MQNQHGPQRLEIGVLYGLRALMVLFVVNYHIWQQSWLAQHITLFGRTRSFDFFTRSGYLFVDGMILLSGFLLFLPYARQTVEGTPVPGAKRFYLNRLARILPSYAAAVLIAFFAFALPQGAYASAGDMWRDLLSHLTFTFLWSPQTYLYTPLNGALWTIAVEMQLYLIFPLLARAAQKKPALTLSLMAAAGLGYRLAVAQLVPDTAMYLNQMPAFLDVYALGMLGAMVYCRLRAALPAMSRGLRHTLEVLCVALACCCAVMVCVLLKTQSVAGSEGYAALRLSQMRLRLPIALTLLIGMLATAHMPRVLQKLLDNRLMRFLAAISMNLYIWHQILSVQMRKAWFVDADALHASPQQQRAFTLLCLSVSILAAMIATYGLEQPASRRLKHLFERKNRHERSQTGNPQPSTDPLLLQPESGGTGADREFRA